MRDYQFGEFVYKLRSERKLSQSKLGELVGVSNKAVSKWENGVSKPSMDTLKKLAEVFDVSVEELLDGKRASDVDEDNGASAEISDDVIENESSAPPSEEIKDGAQKPISKGKILKFSVIAALALLVVAALVAVAVLHIGKLNDNREEPPQVTTDVTTEPASSNDEPVDAFPVLDLEAVKDSVVKIETNLATGSGFCAIKNNWIITNYHVIEGSNKIYIIDDDEKKSEISDIVFYDEDNDIAVLSVKSKFTPIELGDGNSLALRDAITVIGSPQGVLNTVSEGIISNVSYEEYIVISAPISPGSSGGVLLNDKLQAIGIITATAKNELAQNLNFAINIEKLKTANEAYKDGKYPSPDYPLSPEGTPSSPGNTDTQKPEEIPAYLISSKPEYIKSESLFRIEFSIGSNYGQSISADIDLGLVVTNSEGEVVYDAKRSVKAADFSTDPINIAIIDLPTSEISEGSVASGKITVKLIYKGKEVDRAEWELQRGLPVKTEPFETLSYSGNGVGSIAGVNLPHGTYNIIFTHDGSATFEVELNGRNIYRSIFGKTSYVYQLKPDEDMHYEGTPLKNAVFNIVGANGPWTVTIERADTSTEGRTYVDGLTYTGRGIGYVKDIYLPYGTYNITITHSGSSIFEIQLDGRSILRQFGQISYVYTLKPEEEMYYSGTPMPSAYFNITEADGDWSITINKVS